MVGADVAGRALDRVTGQVGPAHVAVLVRFVIGIILGAFAINAVGYVVEAGFSAAGILVAVACQIALLVVQLVLAEPGVQRSRWAPAALGGQACLVYIPLVFFQNAWTGMVAFLAGSVLLVVRPVVAWPTFAVITASAAAAQVLIRADPISIAYIVANTVTVGLVVYGLSRLRSLAAELHETRTSAADAALTRQRLQFANDLRDLLGRRLSGIAVKAELGRRLVPAAPAGARRELGEIIEIARDALADIRSIASSYRAISLDDELASVRSALAAAGVAVTLRRDPGELPPVVGTALAAALRECVTGSLRHGAARRCAIELTIGAGVAVLDVVDDGHDEVAYGSQDLEHRIEALDGTLTATRTDGDRRFRVRVPVATAPPERPAAAVPAERLIAPRLAQAIVAGFAAAYLVVRVIFVLVAELDPVGSIVAIGSATACVLLQFTIIRARTARTARALLLPQAVLAFLPILLYQDEVLGAVGVVAGSVLLVLRPRAGLVAFAALVVCSAVLGGVFDGSWLGISYPLLVTINNGLEWATLLFLYGLVSSLHAARAERAVLAVMKERLRFARDLHDLLGYSVSAIALKAELARRLVDVDAERADTEIAEIADVARKALTEIRSITRSRHELALDDEISSARTLLAAAGIAVTAHVDDAQLPVDVRTALATVLREGITNVLRHSAAERCEITLAVTDDDVTLEIVNDGAVAPGAAGGVGVRNLTARVDELGGHLSAAADADNAFRLHARVPLVRRREPAR